MSDRKSFKFYLKNFDCTFEKDLDELWTLHDIDGNGYLNKQEA